MTDTFRALCAELTYCWSRTTNPDDFAENAAPIIGRMRAALAQPKPEALTDEEILNLSEEHCVSHTRPGGDVIYPYKDGTDMKDDVLSFARALIAADRARWGRPATPTETP